MSAYTKETEKPYGSLLVDNQPKTTSDKQVVADFFLVNVIVTLTLSLKTR